MPNAWLGREDSNLRMVESKSGNPLNDFSGYSEKSVEFSLRSINMLAPDSERYCVIVPSARMNGNFVRVFLANILVPQPRM